MKHAQAKTTYLKNYKHPAFLIESTDLDFDLYEDHAQVCSTLVFIRNEAAQDSDNESLLLHGQELVLEKLLLNGKELGKNDYLTDSDTLTIPDLANKLGGTAQRFTLECHTRIEPQNNTALEGLYKSGKMFCTQCEAEGFRRITYYLDRPDVMSVFTTTIHAEKARYPVLLSNGNPIDAGLCSEDPSRHWAKWNDPFKKPSYLFALVAGDLEMVEDSFTTMSGRVVDLRIFVEAKDLDKCDHAMNSLKNAMTWDEEVYGREYDLDIFMIVAVDDFNMGAMENKGLNIFNTSCVLANPKTTTDAAFQRVEAVVAHEYFHNWSGNRVTCRDWFQLSLKEGFTVFRDSEFSADMGSRTVKRIEDVSFLRTVQFAEDSGPMAHSVRPDSYMEISNFYTVTIYEKGAEVVRMISQLLGPELFRAGTDLYFLRHDGQAVTTEDFVKAMEDASGIDLGLFRNWYRQAGTPVLDVSSNYSDQRNTFELTVNQSCPPTPGQDRKDPFHIPLSMGLLGCDGKQLPLILEGESRDSAPDVNRILDITQPTQTFVFENINEEPVPSLLRGFSAPVRLNFNYRPEELYFLMVHDSDGFSRWNASQALAERVMGELNQQWQQGNELKLPELLVQAHRGVLEAALENDALDQAMVSQLLTLPSVNYLIEAAAVADVAAIHEVREFLCQELANDLVDLYGKCYERNIDKGQFSVSADAMARRSLKNLSLSYLTRTGSSQYLSLCLQQFEEAGNMTDQLAALRCLVNSSQAEEDGKTEQALGSFYEQWRHEPLVVDQWFAVQAASLLPTAFQKVQGLLDHPDFEIRNPNKVRSLIGVFCSQNHVGFHHASGKGYEFLADQVLNLDQLNPQIAARLLTPLTRWKKFDAQRSQLMLEQLKRIKSAGELSKDVFEIVEKSAG